MGLFDKKIDLPKTENWIMMPDAAFTKLISFLGLGTSDIYAYQIVVVASGYSETLASALLGDSVSKVEANGIKAVTVAGSSFTIKNAPDITGIRSQATSTDLILIIGMIGSPIVATMYAFIISRFRTREMAVLKAVGYSNRNVQVMILTEIASVSIIGFIISVFGLQTLLAMNSQYTLNTTYVPLIWNPFVDLFPSTTAIVTFIFVVLSNILGFGIISQKTIRVRPVELFKNVG
jgi:ABC-type antimicrobial peptide transport system permease subunit